jgi:two-component system C4-dicarboxylate transport sensor histidine kinase DctB
MAQTEQAAHEAYPGYAATASAAAGKRRRNKMLRILFGFGIVLALLAAAAGASYQAGQRVGIKMVQAAAVHRLDLFRASFLSPFDKYEYLPGLLASHPTVIANVLKAAGKNREDALNRFLETTNAAVRLSSIYVIDTAGLTIGSSNWQSPDSFVGKNFSFRPYFQDAMKGDTGRFYGIGAVSGLPGYHLARPIQHQDRTIGVLVIKMDLDQIDELWEAGDDEITVSDESGIIFLSSNREWKYRSTRPLTPDAIQKMQSTRQYASMLKPPLEIIQDPIWPYANVVRLRQSGPPHALKRYLVLNYQLPQADWLITTYSSMDEVDAISWRYAASGAGATAFLVLLGLYVLQFRKRMKERQAAQAAADIAHHKLEAKHAELEKLSEHLKTMSISDPLTGCHNRRYFTEISAKMVSAAQRHRRKIAILMIDIDFFKAINDNHGHPAGDEVLKAVAEVCKTTLRSPDFLVRFGGEEFVAVLPDTSKDEALTVAERLRAAVEALQVSAGEAAIAATVSIGLSEYIDSDKSIDKALARADVALYQAKRGGRNRVVTYEAGMEDKAAPAVV